MKLVGKLKKRKKKTTTKKRIEMYKNREKGQAIKYKSTRPTLLSCSYFMGQYANVLQLRHMFNTYVRAIACQWQAIHKLTHL